MARGNLEMSQAFAYFQNSETFKYLL
jgi:hypothetical protein